MHVCPLLVQRPHNTLLATNSKSQSLSMYVGLQCQIPNNININNRSQEIKTTIKLISDNEDARTNTK